MARPSAFAVEPQLEPDEDQLDREPDGDGEDSLTTIYHALSRGSESAARNATAIGQIIGERMVHCASRGDAQALTRWYRTCREIIANIDEER
jgi:hypothetical protein